MTKRCVGIGECTSIGACVSHNRCFKSEGLQFVHQDAIEQRTKRIYIIGSLRNPQITDIAQHVREAFPQMEVFDDWFSAGLEADDYWKQYEQSRGRTYLEALQGHAAKNVYAFDKRHIDASDYVILVSPAGKSGHLELGYSIGKGKKGYILLENDADRWDIMYQFATGLAYDISEIIAMIKEDGN